MLRYGIGAGRAPRRRRALAGSESAVKYEWNRRGKTPAQAQTAARGRAASRAEFPHLLPRGGRQRRPCPRWDSACPPRTPLALSIYSSCLHWPISGSVVSQTRPAVPSTPRCAQSRRHRSGVSGAGRQQVSRGPEGTRPRGRPARISGRWVPLWHDSFACCPL